MAAEILPIHTPDLFQTAVLRSASLLRSSDVVALPTETVYGLAANALDPVAVRRLFLVKGRPPANPIIVHVADLEMARRCVAAWPEAAQRLAASFWPGPLTLVLLRSPQIPPEVTAGGSTVGVRWPSHPFFQAVIRECGFPLATPSANPSGCLSPTQAAHVNQSLGQALQLIVDGGPSQVGIESTVVDLSVVPARVLRPGLVHLESLRASLPGIQLTAGAEGGSDASPGPLKSPGLLSRHYAPKARLVIRRWTDDQDLQRQATELGGPIGRTHVVAYSKIPGNWPAGKVSVIPHDVDAYARALYAELHRCDEQQAALILVEAPPEEAEWHAIADRLRRAASA